MPNLSLLVTSYNKISFLRNFENQIREALLILDAEIVIVDDASTDGSPEAINRIVSNRPRIKFIQHPKNLGSAAARNTALAQSAGDYVFFWDIDDEIDAEVLLQLSSLSQKFRVDVIGGQYEFIGSQKGSASRLFLPANESLDMSICREQFLHEMGYWRYLYKREFLEDTGVRFLPTFQEMGSRFILDDVFWMITLASSCASILGTDQIVYRYSVFGSDAVSWERFLDQARLFPKAAQICYKQIQSMQDVDLKFASQALLNKSFTHVRYLSLPAYLWTTPALIKLLKMTYRHREFAWPRFLITWLFGLQRTFRNSVYRLLHTA